MLKGKERKRRDQMLLEEQRGRGAEEEGVEVLMLLILLIPQHSHYCYFPQQSAQSGLHLGVTAPVLVLPQTGGKSAGTVGSLMNGLSCCCSSCLTLNESSEMRKAVVVKVGEEGHSSWQKWRQNQKRRYLLTPAGVPSQVQTEELQKIQPAAAAAAAGVDAGEVELAVDAVVVDLNQGL